MAEYSGESETGSSSGGGQNTDNDSDYQVPSDSRSEIESDDDCTSSENEVFSEEMGDDETSGEETPESLKTNENPQSLSRTFKCSICQLVFQNMQFLATHTKLHMDAKLAMTQKKALAARKRNNEPSSEWHKCQRCNFFVKTAKLAEHMRCHFQERLFNCPKCKETFKHVNDLVLHSRQRHAAPPQLSNSDSTNSEEIEPPRSSQNYKCKCTRCNLSFSHIDDVNHHLQSNCAYKKVNNIKCSKCDGNFSGSSNFNSHLCKKSFIRRYNFKIDPKINIHRILQDPAKRKALLSSMASVIGQKRQPSKNFVSEQERNQSSASSAQNNGTKVMMRLMENVTDESKDEISPPMEDPLRITQSDSSAAAESRNSTIQDLPAGQWDFQVKSENFSWDKEIPTDEFVQRNHSLADIKVSNDYSDAEHNELEENFSPESSNFNTSIAGHKFSLHDADEFCDIKEHKVEIKVENFD